MVTKVFIQLKVETFLEEKMPFRLAIGSLILFLLSGCAAPLVKYNIINGPDESGATKFQLADTVIKFDLPSELKVYSKPLQITAIPVPSNKRTYSISGTSWYENWGVSTSIKVTHRPDTLLIQEIGSLVSDKRVEVITQMAEVGKNVITRWSGVISGEPEDVALPPSGIVLSTFLQEAQENSKCSNTGNDMDPLSQRTAINVGKEFICKDVVLVDGFIMTRTPKKPNSMPPDNSGRETSVDPGSSTKTDPGSGFPTVPGSETPTDPAVNPLVWGYTYTDPKLFTADILVSGPTPGAVAEPLKMPYSSKSLLYSACRTIHIMIKNENSAAVSEASLTAPDPNWIEFTALPDKGKITLGPRCGADSVGEDYAYQVLRNT